MNSTIQDPVFTAYKIPLSIIVKWPAPNTVDPERRTWLVPLAVTLEVITTLAVAGRFHARFTRKAGQVGLDDVLIAVAWAFATAFISLAIYGVLQAGLDRHVWDVFTLGSLGSQGGLIAWVSEWCFLISTCFTKISILLFHRRIVTRSNNTALMWAIHGAIVFTVVFMLSFLLGLVFMCNPTEASWTSLDIAKAGEQYKCLDRRPIDISVGSLSVFSDAYALLLPQLYLRSLQMAKRQKAALCCIFGCGVVIIIVGIGRTYSLSRLTSDPLRDLTWVGYDTLVWSILEMELAIICASAPALRVYVAKYLVDPATKFATQTTRFGDWSLWSRNPAKTLVTVVSTHSTNKDMEKADMDDDFEPKTPPKESMRIEKKMLFSVQFSDASSGALSPEAQRAYIHGI